LQISQDSVRKELNKYNSISQVIVPEKYRLWETNRPGVLSCPVGISMLDISQYFVLDEAEPFSYFLTPLPCRNDPY